MRGPTDRAFSDQSSTTYHEGRLRHRSALCHGEIIGLGLEAGRRGEERREARDDST